MSQKQVCEDQVRIKRKCEKKKENNQNKKSDEERWVEEKESKTSLKISALLRKKENKRALFTNQALARHTSVLQVHKKKKSSHALGRDLRANPLQEEGKN